MSRVDKHKLISAIYATTLSPNNFDNILDDLDELIFGPILSPAGAKPPQHSPRHLSANTLHAIDPELRNHVDLARQIQDRIGRAKKKEDRFDAVLDAVPNPSYVFDEKQNIVAMNQFARERSGDDCATLGDCIPDARMLGEIDKFAVSAGGRKILVLPDYVDLKKNVQTSVLVRRIAEQDTDGTAGSHFLLSIADFGFDQFTVDLFAKTYSLTEAEADVATLLASGMQAPKIASKRGSSLQTVRSQIKLIKSKTSAKDIPALVHLMCGFTAGILVPLYGDDQDNSRPRSTRPLRSLRAITLRDGRRMEYLEQGAADGKPVLLMHNIPYGVEFPADAIEAAAQQNLRIIAPHRPGFGGSDPLKVANSDTFLDTVARDGAELLDRLNIAKAVVVGHSVGAHHALRLACLFPERIVKLVALGRVPMWRDEWIVRTPPRQRFVLRLARHWPQLLPLVLWVMIVSIERGSAEKFIQSACKDGEADTRAARDPETLALIARGSEVGLVQGTEAMCRDCLICIEDYSAEARSIAHKFHILHGDDDQIVQIFQSRAFVDAVPGTTLEVIEGAGQLLMYSHWQNVLAALKRFQVQAT